MSNEWVKVEGGGANNDGAPRSYTVSAGTAVTYGTLMTLSDPRTAAACAAQSAAIAGVASMAKTATDGITRLSLFTDGIFKVTASGAINVGNKLCAASDAAFPNTLKACTTESASNTASGAAIVGYALETAADGETFEMRLRL